MKTFAEILRCARKAAGLTQEEVARHFNISRAAISQWEKGQTQPDLGKVSDLCALYKLDPTELFLSVAQDAPRPATTAIPRPPVDVNVEMSGCEPVRRVPLISQVAAGRLTEVCDPYAQGAYEKLVEVHEPVSECAFALRVVGDSMTPEFQPGDIIVIDPMISPQPGDYVVAKNHSEEATFKKYRPRGKNDSSIDYFELVPLNPDYPSLRSDLDNLTIIGVQIEHISFRSTRRR